MENLLKGKEIMLGLDPAEPLINLFLPLVKTQRSLYHL
jgi:hypothetical protein